MVGRFVEHQQVRVGDDEPGQRRPGLLAAGQRGRRLRPFVPGEAEPGQGRVDALVQGVAAEDLVPVLEVGVGRLATRPSRSNAASASAIRSRWAAPVRTAERSVCEAMKAASKWASWASRPTVRPRLRWTSPRVRFVAAGRDAEERRLARAVRPDQPDPVAERDRGVDLVEDDERADLAGHAGQPQDAHRPAPDAVARRGRRVAAARCPPVRRRAAARSASSGQAEAPLPGQLGPAPAAPAAPPVWVRRIACAGPVGRRQPLAPRAEVGGPGADHDPLDRAAAARDTARRCAGRPSGAPASSRRRRARCSRRSRCRGARPPRPGSTGSPRTGGARRAAEARGRPQRMEPRRPERLVGVDVADAGEERLVEQERLEPALAPAPSRGGSPAA